MSTSTWPGSSELNIPYGEEQIRKLAKYFQLNKEKALLDMRAMVDGEKFPPEITRLQLAINTIPVSTAVCEREFSQMNLICPDIRSNLTTDNISNLLFININGPPTEMWNPVQYVKSWLLTHKSTEDT